MNGWRDVSPAQRLPERIKSGVERPESEAREKEGDADSMTLP